MKKILFVVVAFLLVVSFNSYAIEDDFEKKENEKVEETKSICPKTKMSESCLLCHQKPNFEVIYNEPTFYLKILKDKNGTEYGYFTLTGITPEPIKDSFDFLDKRDIKKIIIEVQCPGGGVMSAWRIVGIMKYWEKKGFTVETRCHGYAASAGFMILVSGTKGHRYASPHAMLMWHEVQSFKMYDLSDPSKSADEADILRFFQNNGNEWLAEVSNLSKEEIDKKVHKQEWWMSGKEAIEFGFVDVLY